MNKREFIIAYVLARAGLVEKFNGEACVTRAGEIYDAIPTDSDDEGWIGWRGEKPYPEGPVDVRFRDGTTDSDDADAYVWSYDGTYPPEDIVAWRPARD